MDEGTRLIFYKILHLAGLMALFTGAGVLFIQGKNGSSRKPALIFHGIGLALLLVSGFGMMAKMSLPYTSGWFFVKLGIWIFFGASIVLAKRGILKGPAGWAVSLVAGILAAVTGIYKPF